MCTLFSRPLIISKCPLTLLCSLLLKIIDPSIKCIVHVVADKNMHNNG